MRRREVRYEVYGNRSFWARRPASRVPGAEHGTIRPRPVAIWKADPSTGRIECHWTTDPNEVSAWLARSCFEQAGLIMAAVQQGRFGMPAH
ncbi:hypothetical protein ELZ19_08505 [Brucella abortus]|nr:hypothetical protein ELZ19_08505 [Brucella abortus]